MTPVPVREAHLRAKEEAIDVDERHDVALVGELPLDKDALDEAVDRVDAGELAELLVCHPLREHRHEMR